MSQDNRKWGNHTGQSLAGTIWFMGWLFTIAYAKLVWWQIIVGIVIWPFFMGSALS